MPTSNLLWLKRNLFSTWYNSILTILFFRLICSGALGLIDWSLTEADWLVISSNFRLFFAGLYPVKHLWRVWVTFSLTVALGGFSWGVLTRKISNFSKKKILIALSAITLCLVLIILGLGMQLSLIFLGLISLLFVAKFLGKFLGRRVSNLGNWLPLVWLGIFFLDLWILIGTSSLRLDNLSGLILTVFISFTSIALCFPFGILLALGRQSKLPVIHWLSVIYIELIRGIPLIGTLFIAQVMLPLILPTDIRPDRVVRAIAGMTIYSSAYLAENVRGGLQAVSQGQIEAARALGLNPFYTLSFVVLPQALKAVIPSIVGQFISLFKDTSLLAIVGLVDLLGMAQKILNNPRFLGRYGEVYLFVAFVYWICCYLISTASKRLEKKF